MRRIVTGATGLIGKRLVEHWLQQGHEVSVIGRTRKHIEEQFGARVQPLTWDSLTTDHLQSAQVIVNLAGANVGEKRWTPERKQEILSSRIQATTQLARLLAPLGQSSPLLFNASAIGIYGPQALPPIGLPPRFEEISAINYLHPESFLAEVGANWEQATVTAQKAGVRVSFLRFGVVLAREGGALGQMLLPFRLGLGGPIGTGRQAFSWVVIDDVVRAIDFILAQPSPEGAFNIVAPGCVSQREFAQALGQALHRPAFMPMPAFAVKMIFGAELADELLLTGQHVYPLRLLDLGFQFEYPNIGEALHHLLG